MGMISSVGLGLALARALREPGPWFLAVKVIPEKATARPPRDPLFFKYRFMRAIEKPR